MYRVTMSPPRAIYAAPINEATAAWGVYCIPKLWRLPDGRLVIYYSGVKDVPGSPALCPSLFFLSDDNGKTWKEAAKSEHIATDILGNVEFPYLRLRSGNTLCIRPAAHPAPIVGQKPANRFPIPNEPENLYYTYRQADLTPEAFGMERCLYSPDGTLLETCPALLDFDEREIIVIGRLHGRETGYPLSYHACNGSPYITSLLEYPDGTLMGLCTGNDPAASGRYCGEAYLVVSEDGGRNWHKRAVITGNSALYPYGLCGDGLEASLSAAPDGTLYCVTRTNMSLGYESPDVPMDAMLFVSHDGGYHWERERPVADSSVTPHVIALKNGAVAVIYGRPGVHLILSSDGGKTFSSPYSVIGSTRKEERAAGRTDTAADRFDISYSNSFYVMLDDETLLLLYTDLAYDPGDGRKHKTGMLREIRIQNEP